MPSRSELPWLLTATLLRPSKGAPLCAEGSRRASMRFSDGAANGPIALWTLVGLYGLAPVIFKAFAIVLMWRYPITAERQAEIRQRIDESMAQAKVEAPNETPIETGNSKPLRGSPVRDSGM